MAVVGDGAAWVSALRQAPSSERRWLLRTGMATATAILRMATATAILGMPTTTTILAMATATQSYMATVIPPMATGTVTRTGIGDIGATDTMGIGATTGIWDIITRAREICGTSKAPAARLGLLLLLTRDEARRIAAA